jgi:CheY-like chemotaxis protein
MRGLYSRRNGADKNKVPHQLLLADDSVTIQRVVRLTFADEDVDVVTVGDGDEAVAVIERRPPDIVLADVAMPGRTGYEVAQHIRANPHLAHIPVVLLTGAFEPIDEARATELGCDGVLSKPFDPEAVVTRVRELLSRPRTESAVVAPPSDAPAVEMTQIADEPPAIEPAAPAQKAGASRTDVDAYFERLDQAFATLASTPRPAPTMAPEESLHESKPMSPAYQPAAPSPAAVQSLVDAFDGLLTSHKPFAPATTSSSGHESPRPSSVPAAGPLSDDQIEQIVSRVLERLAARMAGGNLSDIVAGVAERLVRAEIEVIKRRL